MDKKKERGMEHRERMEMNTMRHDKRGMHLVKCKRMRDCAVYIRQNVSEVLERQRLWRQCHIRHLKLIN